MNAVALLLLFSAVDGAPGNQSTLEQTVDLIELNHFLDEECRHVFDQVIFYQWSRAHRRYHVVAWRLIKDPSQIPQRVWNPRIYRCVWLDDGMMRCVQSQSFRETWSQVDPERVNRKLLPQEHRVGLHKPMPLPDQSASPEARVAQVPTQAETQTPTLANPGQQ